MANDQESQKAPSQMAERLKLAAAVLVATLLGGVFSAAGTWWFLQQQLPLSAESHVATSEDEPQPPALYENLDPPFVVNLKQGGRARYLQIGVALMGRDAGQLAALKAHLPLLRNQLLLLFSGQEIERLATAEGKEQLRQQATTQVQEMAQKMTGRAVVEQVLFTSLVVQ